MAAPVPIPLTEWLDTAGPRSKADPNHAGPVTRLSSTTADRGFADLDAAAGTGVPSWSASEYQEGGFGWVVTACGWTYPIA